MDSDFEFQLKCEALEKDKKVSAPGIASSLADASGTYVDPQDGTVYEWDTVRKAWFPKIDANFIAMYQAAYGVTEPTANIPASSTDQTTLPASTSAIKANLIEDRSQKVKLPRPRTEDGPEVGRPSTSVVPKGAAGKKQKKTPQNQADQGFLSVEKPEDKEKRKAQETAAWFDVTDEHNRNVYISNLPTDTTEEELMELMSKCGIIMKDPRTNQFKLKLYRDADGNVKGDALCTYMKLESIPLALQILDEYRVRNNVIRVERAKFNLKGEFDAEKAKKQKLKKNDKKRLQKAETKLLDWRPDKLPGERPKNEKVVVIKNMFDTKEFETDPALILELKKDLQLECANFGEVKKVVIYDRHSEGVATIGFGEFDQAAACITKMNGRWFGGRQLSAATWDGKTRYQVQESEEEEQKRLGQWEQFLDGPSKIP